MSEGPNPAGPTSTLGGLELRCPPLPHTLVEAMDLLAHPERMEVQTVTEMVERDPLVVAKLLQRVNSAFYGLHRTVTTPERAVIMLGPVAVVGIVAGMSMLRLRPGTQGASSACFARLVGHSLAVAHLSRHLLEVAPFLEGRRPPRNGTAFTAGLLHDFGKLVLAYNYPEDATALYHERALDALVAAADGSEQEALVFGYDHTEAGAFAAIKLQFPDVLSDVVRLHHQPEALRGQGVPPDTARLLRGVVAASRAASAMGYGASAALDWDTAAEHPIWDDLVVRDIPAFGTGAALIDHVRAQAEDVERYARTVVGPLEAPALPLFSATAHPRGLVELPAVRRTADG